MQLVIVDTSGIQRYIFGSNRLRENVGASYLVDQATGPWALDAVPRPNNIAPHVGPDGPTLRDDVHIEADPSVRAEVLYAGGGNLVVLCRDERVADEFERTLSERVLIEAPGLRLVTARRPFRWNDGDTAGEVLRDAVAALVREDLARAKRTWTPSEPLLGLGVTKACASTGLPAVAYTERIGQDDESTYPASASILAKRRHVQAAAERLHRLVPPPEGFAYPLELDHLGRSHGEASYIAVVHADGNGMGRRFREIGAPYGTTDQNRAYIRAVRGFSEQVKMIAREALQDTLQELFTRIKQDRSAVVHHNAREREVLRIDLEDRGGTRQLPVRPIVFGGDDVTFVSDGRLGIALARSFLEAFERRTSSLEGGRATACAGIAIVKVRYPFARAYDLAEELTHSAKRLVRLLKDEQGEDLSAFDWHFTTGGLYADLEAMRNREYEVPAGKLTLRPLTLGHNRSATSQLSSWPVVERLTHAFQQEEWLGRRNKLKRLRDVLRQGPEATERLTQTALGLLPPPGVVDDPSIPRRGWSAGTCVYYDALELAELYAPIHDEPVPAHQA